MGAEDMTKQDLFNQLKDLIIATEDRLAARTDKTDARLDGIASDFNAWRPRLEGRVDALQSAVAALQRQAATNVPPAEVPTPANPTDEVLAPAISDSDAKLVTIDVGGPAAPAPTTAPTERMTTIDIVPVLAAPATTDGTLHGQAVSGVLSTPATCLMVCLARDPVASPVLVASSVLAPPECVHGTNTIHVAALPLVTMGGFPAVLAPMDSTPTVQLQQLYNDSEFFMLPTSSQCITTKVDVHHPMPWPSFVGVHADEDEARPLPWPSFREINGCEFPSDVVTKASGLCISDSSHAESCASIEFQFSEFCALPCEYLGVDTTACSVSWLLAGCLLAVCRESSVKSSTECCSAIDNVAGLLSMVDWPLMDSHCRTAVTVCLSCPEEADHYFCCSELKKSVVLLVMRSSSYSLICDEWVLSPWDPGQPVVSDFTDIFYSYATFDIYLQKLMLQSLAYSVGMVVYCSSFSCTREDTSCESILTPDIFSFA